MTTKIIESQNLGRCLFVNMENVITFAVVKGAHPTGCLTSGKDLKRTHREEDAPQISVGSVFLRHAVRAKLWFARSLVQVNSVLDESKPCGIIVFFMGAFFFCFPFFKVLNTFCFLLFSFE